MNNPFPSDHLFTRLLAARDAQIAAAYAEQELQEQQQSEAKKLAQQTCLDNIAVLLGPEFMAAIQPHITSVRLWTGQFPLNGLTLHIDLPEHETITLHYDHRQHCVRAQTIGLSSETISNDLTDFAQYLKKARAKFADDAKGKAAQAAWEKWEQECSRIHDANRDALNALQAEMDEQFQLWTLTYALVSEEFGEDHTCVLDTDSIMVTQPHPNDNGWWPTVNINGVIHQRQFFYAVSLTESGHIYRASERNYSHPVMLGDYGIIGHLSPTTSPDRINEYKRRAAALITPLPDHPHDDRDEENVPF